MKRGGDRDNMAPAGAIGSRTRRRAVFESAELGRELDKATFKAKQPELREALLEAQFELAERRDFSVVVLISGVDAAGKGETVNTLNFWMDPRLIETNAMGEPTQEERERPRMWRFWRALPPRGKIGIFFGTWYTVPIVDRVYGKSDDAGLQAAIDEILRFEAMLASEGTLVLKYWLHLSKDRQRERLKALERDAHTRWRVADDEWERFQLYDTFRAVSEITLRRTSVPHAPWIVVEGSDARYRLTTTARSLLESLRARLENAPPSPAEAVPPKLPELEDRNVLRALDLTGILPRKKYRRELGALQSRLNLLSRHKKMAERSVVLVFEGVDAAGKGGTIRRVAGALDARFYRIIQIAAPSDEERAHPYLWRFWRHLPRAGHFTIFDRSWYGRVLVERVEGFAAEADWTRAYGEINDFEFEMNRHGIVVVKFWLHISREEQYRRLKERQKTGHKRYKLTEEDWRNRMRWDAYEEAVCDMVARTGTSIAPWHLVSSEDKYAGRVEVLKTICETIDAAL